MTEADIRKKLYKYLAKRFPHLTPISEEEHVKYGTQYGFIDILARDDSNNLVIIELKKTNVASRQAIHEVIKYTEFLKETYAVNDDEIKIIIMSTEWKELRIPFSKFCASNDMYEIEGIQLNIDSKANYISHSIIQPIKLTNRRLFSARHLYAFYKKESSMKRGVESFNKVMKTKKISDYVLLVLKRPENIEYPHNHKFIIYFAMLSQTKEKYEKIFSELDKDGESEYLARSSYDMLGLASYEKALNLMAPLPESDDMIEQGKPLYLDMLILKEKWKLKKVIKRGRLEKNILLDDVIVDELIEYTGNGNVIYFDKFNITDKRKLKKAKDTAKRLLSNNDLWKNQFSTCISQLEEENDKENEVTIEIYNPTNILLSIYQEVKFVQESVNTAMPFFKISIPNKKISYFGTLIWKKNKTYSLDNILDSFYVKNDLDKQKGFFMCSQTNHIAMHDKILEYLNLEYNTLRIKDDIKTIFYNGSFRTPSKDVITIIDFIHHEQKFCIETTNKFEKALLSI